MIDTLSKNEALAEALLFAAGDSVKLADIAIVLKLDKKDTEKVMDRLMKIYEERHVVLCFVKLLTAISSVLAQSFMKISVTILKSHVLTL
jgi:chromosome segregation and condensation protein ScpB